MARSKVWPAPAEHMGIETLIESTRPQQISAQGQLRVGHVYAFEPTHHGHVITMGLAADNFALGAPDARLEPRETGLGDAIRELTSEMGRLRRAVEAMSSQIEALSEKIDGLASGADRAPRDLPDDEAMLEIRRFFEEHNGETIYPSEIANELNLAYDTVTRLIENLERDGQIAKS